jgi:hypothetical protein
MYRASLIGAAPTASFQGIVSRQGVVVRSKAGIVLH